jgi:AraC family transcriptional regulator
MTRENQGWMQVEAELHAPAAMAQIVRFRFPEAIDNVTRMDDGYRLDLCLSPRPNNARVCYPDRWNTRRFERLGGLFLQPAGVTMHARSDGGCEQASLQCVLAPELMRNWMDEELEWTDGRLLAGLDIRDATIRGLLLRLGEEARHPGFASKVLVELITAQLAIELARYCSAVSDAGPKAGGLAPWRLRLIDERLREEREPPTLVELAGLCRLSVRQLTRGFRTSRGCSIGEYVAEVRVENAKRLLISAQSIKSIAYSLGFASPSSFCHAFRRATGETPGQFRARLPRAR